MSNYQGSFQSFVGLVNFGTLVQSHIGHVLFNGCALVVDSNSKGSTTHNYFKRKLKLASLVGQGQRWIEMK